MRNTLSWPVPWHFWLESWLECVSRELAWVIASHLCRLVLCCFFIYSCSCELPLSLSASLRTNRNDIQRHLFPYEFSSICKKFIIMSSSDTMVLGLAKYPRWRNKPCCNTHQQTLIVIIRIYFWLLFLSFKQRMNKRQQHDTVMLDILLVLTFSNYFVLQ